MNKFFKIVGVVVLVLALSGFAFFVMATKASPPQITANFTELDKIEKISKYRSCAGHTTVPQNKKEMKRSMKHYFWVKPEYLGNNKVEIYAPYDGYVTVVREDRAGGLEGEIWIALDDIFVMLPPMGRWMFSVQHIDVRDGLKRGSKVKAGELIGHGAVSANNRETFDIVFGKGAFLPKTIDNWNSPFADLDSVFNQMTAGVFGEYKTKGITKKENIIIGKDERDQNPCTYKDDGPYFLNQDRSDNWIILQRR